MPSPGSEIGQRLIQAVWDLFDLDVGWPTVERVASRLDHRYDLVLEDVLSDVPAALLYGVHPGRMPSDQETIGLTLAGAAAAEGSAEILRLVVVAVQLAAQRQREWEPPPNDRDAKPTLSAADLVEEVTVPPEDRPVLLARAGELLRSENWGWTSAGFATRDAWSFAIDRRVRRFRDVADFTDLWNRAHPSDEPAANRPTTDWDPAGPVGQITPLPEERTQQIFHVQVTKGSGFTGTRSDTWWDLDEAGLEEKILQPRREGRALWRGGTEYAWAETRVQVYEGPPTKNIPNFSPVLGPALLAVTDQVRDVTDHWITGPAGGIQAMNAATPQRRYQVFLSSTFVDLQQERVAVTQELLRMGRCIPAGMELFGASSLPPWDVITRVLDVTDYLVLELGHRYGSTPPGGGPSYTEREYDYALARDIPILAFVSDPSRPVPPQHVESDADAQQALAQFRQRVEHAHTVTTWSSAEDLKIAVVNALYQAMADTPRPGWVRGPATN